MAEVLYPAVLEEGANGSWGVWFPDLPGCVSAGDSPEEAVRGAHEALALHVEGMIEDGEPLPAPSQIDAKRIPEGTVNPVWTFISLELNDEWLRVNITLNRSLLKRIDRAAAAEGHSRSGWLAEAARDRLKAHTVPLEDVHRVLAGARARSPIQPGGALDKVVRTHKRR